MNQDELIIQDQVTALINRKSIILSVTKKPGNNNKFFNSLKYLQDISLEQYNITFVQEEK